MKSAMLAAAAALLGAATLVSPALAQAPDAKKGREIFVKKGCWGCHGYNGQGATAVNAPRLAPDPMPLEAMIAYLRNASSTAMPPYDAVGLPDAEVGHIRAYLASLPKPVDWKTIPLLKD